MGLRLHFRSPIHLSSDGAPATAKPQADRPTSPIAFPAWMYYPQYVQDAWGLSTVDDLVAHEGLAPYREMIERCDQTQACLHLVQFARLSAGWGLNAASDDPLDVEIRDLVQDAFDYLENQSFDRVLMYGMDALGMGFSCVEPRWRPVEERGYWEGKQLYKSFMQLPQETVTFHSTEFAEVDEVWQSKARQMVVPGLDPAYFNRWPRDRFVVWSWLQKWGHPLGRSVLRPAYRYYMAKKQGLHWWARWMEYYGVPWLIGEVPEGMQAKEQAAVLSKLKGLQSQQRAVMQSGQKLTIVEPSTAPGQNFESFMNFCNRGIARAIFTPATLVDLQATGSYALSTNQKNVYEWILENLGRLLSTEYVDAQIIRPLVERNYGPDVDCPKFRFNNFSEPDRMAIATVFKMVADMGVPVATAEVRQALNIKTPSAEEETIGPSTSQTPEDDLPQDTNDRGNGLNDILAQIAGVTSNDPATQALAADWLNSRGDDRIDVLKGNGKRSREYARDGFEGSRRS